MSIALNSVETPDPMMALGELPTMPLPPQLLGTKLWQSPGQAQVLPK